MNQREEIIERLQALKLEGGSHQMLSDICRAVAPGAKYGWTQGACDGLRLRLISFLSETDEEALREAYTKGHNDGFDRGFASADDWCAQHEDAMVEHGWVKLPKDADGEYIHIGDRMEKNERVARIVLTDDSWEPSVYLEKLPNVLHEHFCNEISHYHAPTVEDVLTEMANRIYADEDEPRNRDAIVAEYAKRLRLAGDVE